MLKELISKARVYLLTAKTFLKNPKYIKYLPFSLKSPLASGLPWLNYDAKEWLDKNLNKEMVVFEYGCGGSTVYLADRVKKIISVDHEQSWCDIVRDELSRKKISNFVLFSVPPEENSSTEDILNLSTDPRVLNKSFKRYIEKINDYPDNAFDLVVVDGRARNGCVSNALAKIKHNGYLLLDNSERKEYLPSLELLNKFKVETFFGPGIQSPASFETKIWQVKKY